MSGIWTTCWGGGAGLAISGGGAAAADCQPGGAAAGENGPSPGPGSCQADLRQTRAVLGGDGAGEFPQARASAGILPCPAWRQTSAVRRSGSGATARARPPGRCAATALPEALAIGLA